MIISIVSDSLRLVIGISEETIRLHIVADSLLFSFIEV